MKTTPSSHTRVLMWILFAVAVLGIAVAANSSLITSAERRELRFSHSLHAQQNLACDACHAAASSKSGADDLLPGHTSCGDCHDVTTADACKTCHLSSSPKPSPRVRDYSRLFSHERHAAGKVECAICHTDLDGTLEAGQVGHLPPMQDCMTCHDQRRVGNECATCHLPKENRAPVNHDLSWLQNHGAVAAVERDTRCAMCHDGKNSPAPDCQRCHNGDAVLSPHPRNYIARHGQDAHLSDVSCSVCHEDRSFCSECHRSMNVLPSGHSRPGWATRDGGDHTTEAEFDLESCMACHESPDREPVCVQCHGRK